MSKDADDKKVVARGSLRTIAYATGANGSMPAKDLIEGLDESDQRKIAALFQRMADQGKVANREQFKKVEDDLFEFKKHQTRVFCFRRGNTWFLTNGYRKKKKKLDPSEVARARRIRGEHVQREAKEEGGCTRDRDTG